MIKSVAITGASGFVGRHLTNILLQKNYQVICLTRGLRPQPEIKWPAGVEVREINWEDPAALRRAVRGVDAVVHAAAIHPPRSTRNRAAVLNANVEGTRKLLHSLDSVERFVMVSSMRALVNKNQPHTTFTEESGYDFEKYDTPYGYSKHLSEKVCLEFSEKNKLPLIIVNPTPIIGQGDIGPSPNGQFIKSFLTAPVVFMLETTYSFVDVVDVAQAIEILLNKGQSGQRYLLCAANWPLRKFIEEVLAAAKMRKRVVALPLPLAYTAAVFFEMLERTLPGFNAPLIRSSVRFAALDPAFAGSKITATGFTYTPPEQTIKAAVEWILENYLPVERKKQ